MKQKDLLIIGAVVLFSAVISYVVGTKLIATPADRHQQVQTVPVITEKFNQPDPKYFNAQAVDPTKIIQISNNSSVAQFNTAGQ